jgi:PhoPQ-activated pathogenicity-related protein
MVSGTTDNFGTGSSATVWLENLPGTVALVRSINQPVVQPNTAVRFTPIP